MRSTVITSQPADSLVRRGHPRRAGKDGASSFHEAGIWQATGGEWRRLFGGFHDCGVSIEWHDLPLASDFDWSRSFHPGSVELCLNVSGEGLVSHRDARTRYEPLTAGFYSTGERALKASRRPAERHQFITVEFSPRFLSQHLRQCDGALHPLVDRLVQGDRKRGGVSEICRLTTEQQQLIGRLLHPPVFQGARSLWYQSKVLELMADFFFERQGADELFCDRQKRQARLRVDRVVAILRQRLAEPPSLEEIGREVGCSAFYLSRLFSKEMGMTMPQFLRQIRMERAAGLLRSGKFNVTEAALEVGYNSISHFSQAFCQTIGCCPNLYPHAKALLQTPPAVRPPTPLASA